MSNKENTNKDLLKKNFITEEGYDKLEERLRKEVEKKKADFREQLYNEIRGYNFRISQ